MGEHSANRGEPPWPWCPSYDICSKGKEIGCKKDTRMSMLSRTFCRPFLNLSWHLICWIRFWGLGPPPPPPPQICCWCCFELGRVSYTIYFWKEVAKRRERSGRLWLSPNGVPEEDPLLCTESLQSLAPCIFLCKAPGLGLDVFLDPVELFFK